MIACILTRYDKTTETNCVDCARWVGIPRGDEGECDRAGAKPAYDGLIQKFPNTLIHTSGPYVGLPEGQMGNSEVGHMNMGAGRIVHMDITRIDLLIANKQLQNVPLFSKPWSAGDEATAFCGLLATAACTRTFSTPVSRSLEMVDNAKQCKKFLHCFMRTPTRRQRGLTCAVLNVRVHAAVCSAIPQNASCLVRPRSMAC